MTSLDLESNLAMKLEPKHEFEGRNNNFNAEKSKKSHTNEKNGNSAICPKISTLADVAIGEKFIVKKLVSPDAMPEWAHQLEDIGFIAGEPVTLMARGAFGGDPMVVRIGQSTFALRKAEAACVIVDLPRSKVAA
jgi:ferrous iron transport protein A